MKKQKKVLKEKQVKEKPLIRKGKPLVKIDKGEYLDYLELKKDVGEGNYEEFLKWKVDKKMEEEDDWEAEVGGSEEPTPFKGNIIADNGKDIIIREFDTGYLYAIARVIDITKFRNSKTVTEKSVLVRLRR